MEAPPNTLGVVRSADPASKADTVIRALAEGRAVAPTAIADAKQELLSQLRSHSKAAQTAAGEHLAVLYRTTRGRADRWELAGQLVVAGSPGALVLEREIKEDSPIAFLKELAHVPVVDQLRAVAQFLASIVVPVGGTPPPRPFPLGQMPESPDIVTRKEDLDSDEKPPDPQSAADGPPELEKRVLDSDQPPEVRLAAAKQLGALAVPSLIKLLHRSDSDRELAVQALLTLSTNNDALPVIQRGIDLLVAQDRSLADYLRTGIASTKPGATDHSAAWARSRTAPITDTWLRRAVQRRDAMGILQAGLGREAATISMVLRHCGELITESE